MAANEAYMYSSVTSLWNDAKTGREKWDLATQSMPRRVTDRSGVIQAFREMAANGDEYVSTKS